MGRWTLAEHKYSADLFLKIKIVGRKPYYLLYFSLIICCYFLEVVFKPFYYFWRVYNNYFFT